MARGGKREGARRKRGSTDKKSRSSPVLVAPAQEKRELRVAAREHTVAALGTLVKICNEGQSEAARVSAANSILDRGYGKPLQQIESGGPNEFSRMTDEELEAFLADELPEVPNGKARH